MRMKNYMAAGILLVALTSCLDMTITYRVNENGKVTSILNYRANSEYGNFLIPQMRDNLIREGYTITKYSGRTVEGIIYTDVDVALNNSIFQYESENSSNDGPVIDAKFKTAVKNEPMKKTFVIDYEFPKNEDYSPGSSSSSDWGRSLALGILSSFNLSFIISMPGDIVETTGETISHGTVQWEYNMLELLQDGGRIYLKSQIDNSPASAFSAQKSTQKRISKVYSRMDELKFRTIQLDSIKNEQIRVNKNIDKRIANSDRFLLQLINLLCEDYYQSKHRYPAGIDDIRKYNKKLGYEELPDVAGGKLIFDAEKHIFRIEE